LQTSSFLYDLFRHMSWADSVVWNSILGFAPAEKDTKIWNLLHHFLTIQQVYLSVWINEPVDIPEISKFDNLYALSKWGYEFNEKTFSFIDSLQEDKFNSPVILPWSTMAEHKLGKKLKPATLLDTMLEVISHSAYHRGQINIRFREIGGEPELVDFIMWVWLGKPKAEWLELAQ